MLSASHVQEEVQEKKEAVLEDGNSAGWEHRSSKMWPCHVDPLGFVSVRIQRGMCIICCCVTNLVS